MKLYELTDKVSDKMMFEFKNPNKIGHMRVQLGEEKMIANQFIANSHMDEKVKEFNINLEVVNEVCNVIQFEWINNYDMVEAFCKGGEYDKKETNYFLQHENVNYWIRLNPFGTSEYNLYIHIFHN